MHTMKTCLYVIEIVFVMNCKIIEEIIYIYIYKKIIKVIKSTYTKRIIF